ncbi:hypothetical protein ACJ3XI_08775 [Litorimonas sp. RW-G-Af-16]|uniref:hypothetical protein n=1 Tax=Litorimonas sp. RW-G-Af-16 TaxID=3241168 RepID=UPI00390C62CD
MDNIISETTRSQDVNSDDSAPEESGMLKGWTPEHTQKFQKDIISFGHRLNETGLFTDEALIELLRKHPSESLDVCTMGPAEHPLYPNKFRTGDFRNVDPAVLLEAAKAGKVWINVRRGMNLHPEYKAVLDQMYGGIAEKTGNKAFTANGGILISSPMAKVPYHFDKTEVILWHVRGKKRVYLYPQTEKYIPDHAFEATLMTELEDDLPYSADFDQDAIIFDLQPDQAITWPLNSPHRVDNQAFCVSVTTEYSTRESGMKNAAMIANATLRHRFGVKTSYRNAGGVERQVKSILGRVIKKTGMAVKEDRTDMVTFTVDPNTPDFIRDIEPFERNF